jgi:transcriptional regulator with XRE-family HTH domain
MTVRADLESQARQRKAKGQSYQEIADALNLNERTIRRWSKNWGNTKTGQMVRVVEAESYVILDTSEREWPNWTVDDLAEILPERGFRPDLWEVNIELVHAAERQGNEYVPWFFRNLIELARRRDMPDGSLAWSVAIAGLPVLAEWLNCPPCVELGEFVENLEPWAGRRQRTAYRREVRTTADAVQQCILRAHGRMAMEDYVSLKVSNGTKAMGELGKYVPLFDRIPLRLRSDHLGKVLLDIFVTSRGE